MVGENIKDVNRIILTGSGGPFRTRDVKTFPEINLTEALNHPNWSMGKKITIDSATMMNKGLEVIEARWLFNLEVNQIDILIHPQSIIHSMVEFKDRSIKAQLGIPDMKIPIQYAITYPRHALAEWEKLDLAKIGNLTFEEKDVTSYARSYGQKVVLLHVKKRGGKNLIKASKKIETLVDEIGENFFPKDLKLSISNLATNP